MDTPEGFGSPRRKDYPNNMKHQNGTTGGARNRIAEEALRAGLPGQEPPKTLADHVVRGDEFLGMDLGTEEWLIDGLLTKGGTAALVGTEKSGKTTIATQIALSVIRGTPFMGRNVNHPTAVLLHDEEGSKIAWQRRIGRASTGLKLTPEQQHQLHFLHRKQYTYTNDSHLDELAQYIVQHGIGLVIAGPLRQIAAIEDENRANEINTLMRGFNAMAEALGTTFLVVHHRRKASGRGMDRIPSITDMFDSSAGTNAFMGAVDSSIAILRPDDDQPNAGLMYWRLREQDPNQRGMMGKDPFTFNPDNYLISPSSSVTFNKNDAKDQAILDHLFSHGWTTGTDIQTLLHLGSKSAARDRCAKLVAAGSLREREGHRKAREYDLSEATREDMSAERGIAYEPTDALDMAPLIPFAVG